MSDRLSNRVAIVTGAARGIGKAIVGVLARHGASVLFTDVDDQRGKSTESELIAQNLSVKFLRANASRPKDNQKMVEAAIGEFGKLDILCPNAAIFPETWIENISEAEWDQVLAVNLKGPFLAIQSALDPMKRNRYGRIIITSSITGPVVSVTGHAHYAAAKAGLMGLIRTAALELAQHNININAVQPGNILTDAMRLERSAEFQAAQTAAIPLGRLGEPEDVAHAVLFLASDEASYITGQAIVLDGGQAIAEHQGTIVPLSH